MEEIQHCNKCGFCLPACPTYQLTGNELHSPRGRIAMVEAAIHGEIDVGRGLEESLTYCLDCRACEVACPSGVRYHRVLESGRNLLRKTRARPMSFAVRQILRLVKRPGRLRTAVRLGERIMRVIQPRPLKPLIPLLGYKEQNIPPLTANASPEASVQFFEGCVMQAQFSDANQSAKNLLGRGRIATVSPERQGCCGALHLHSGYTEDAKAMARNNIEAFEDVNDSLIVNTAGGCGAMLMQYGELLADDPLWSERARRFSQRVRDWATVFREVSQKVPLEGQGQRVVLQNSCHLVNVEHAGEDSVALLRTVAGDTFISYPEQDRCCGSAGTYNIEHPAWASEILESKMALLTTIAPDVLIVNNPGCHLQMRQGMSRLNGNTESVQHIAVYLERAAERAEKRTQREGANYAKTSPT
ncbi:MAG: heterodisulfide reductase-related iron-sulfur binding cluster [Firmicutes bacterium]|uniref:Glycolate oxidase iron-sulfur subunit n=1 Tax=Sulfobacillus benefaciens TaxID=453960 RepID=A0A2T2XAP6_9FIRM|nr:heterodisulfide reductase-related iron-sulfur binding cluster [Bacillota bacterium]PSR31565.1 MAG: (Fe-S)-binding protein [Sulfobacillus benefaciens]